MATAPIAENATALVLIDLQRRIVDSKTTPYSGAEVASRCGRLAEAFRAAGQTVVIVRIHRGGQENEGDELVPEAVPAEGEILITKPAVSAFAHTDLDARLREKGITTLVLGGIATEYGVESTLRSAFDRGYKLVVASDAVTGLDPVLHQTAVERLFRNLGTVLDTEAIIAALA